MKSIVNYLITLTIAVAALTLTGCATTQQTDGITITQTKRGVEISSANSILFDTGKYELEPSGQKFLDRVANIMLTKTKKNAIIEGHTDNVGGATFNQDLSELRALTVMKGLVDRGVPKNRLKAVGYGVARPVADNSTDNGRRLNRRTDIIIVGESTNNIGNPFMDFLNNLFK